VHGKVDTGETRANDWILRLVCACRWYNETVSHGSGIPHTPYYTGISKVLCMETPVQDVVIGNTPGALGVEPRCQTKTVNTIVNPGVSNTQSQKMKNTGNNPESSEAGNEQNDTSRLSVSVVTTETNATETFAAIQTRSVDIRVKTKLETKA